MKALDNPKSFSAYTPIMEQDLILKIIVVLTAPSIPRINCALWLTISEAGIPS